MLDKTNYIIRKKTKVDYQCVVQLGGELRGDDVDLEALPMLPGSNVKTHNEENLREKRRKKCEENLLSQKTSFSSIFWGKLPEKTDVYTSSNVKMQNKKIVIKNAVFLFLNIPPW